MVTVIFAAGAVGSAGSTFAMQRPIADRVVHPTGKFPADVENVQAAVDRGGTVLLKATDAAGRPAAFNFGSPQASSDRVVSLRTDVAVLGETVSQGQTTIEGGFIPFFSRQKVRTKIQGINFEGPLLSAIIIVASTRSQVLDNRISGVVGLFLPFIGLTEGRGIKFLGNSDPGTAITGTVRVAGNVIEDMHADLPDAIVFDSVAADTEIVANRVDTVQSSGILVIRSRAIVSIANNHVRPGPGDAEPEFSFGNGITVVGSRGAAYRLERNQVLAENPKADGILLLAPGFAGNIDGPVLDRNTVEMRGSHFGAITMTDGVSRATVTGTIVRGTGARGMNIVSLFERADTASSNTFVGNNVALFQEEFADFFLDVHTRDTVLTGNGGTVIDLGTGSRVTGPGPVGRQEHIGRQIRDAQRAKQKAAAPALTGGRATGEG